MYPILEPLLFAVQPQLELQLLQVRQAGGQAGEQQGQGGRERADGEAGKGAARGCTQRQCAADQVAVELGAEPDGGVRGRP